MTRTQPPSRTGSVQRTTKETDISIELNLDGAGQASIATGVGFLDHMLDHVARHGLFDLAVQAKGDVHIDDHHTVEDVGICLGQALVQALGDKAGIERFGSAQVPMDESLAQVTIDLSGRFAFVYNVSYRNDKIGSFDTQLVEEFLHALAQNARCNLHVNVPYGTNSHHIAEAIFKALGRALRQAVNVDPRRSDVPSTKGVL